MAKTVKKKANLRGFLVILLIIYLIGSFLYYLINLPIKNINIIGTYYLTDNEIIETAKVKNYPPIFRLNTFKIKKNLKSLDLVNDVHIYRTITGKLTIDIDENKVLYYNLYSKKVILSNLEEVNPSEKFMGYPTLINHVPDKILKEFNNKFKDIDSSVISLISEIEYSQETLDGLTLNENRFLLRMNDGNTVYVDTVNLSKLNNYPKYHATIEDGILGVYRLDSNSKNISFNSYQDIEAEVEENEIELQPTDEGTD